jgi:CRP-like cAMP-binding protein
MATSFATVASVSSRFTQRRSFPTRPVAHTLKVVSTKTSAPPQTESAFDLQTPIDKLIAGKTQREYVAGDSVFSQGDPANAVFYIQSGKVKLTVVSMSGKEAVIAHLPTASFFGEASLAGQQLRTASAHAIESSVVIRIEKSVMQELLHREPEFAEQFLAHLLSRNIRMEADLVDHLSRPLRQSSS